MENNKEGGKVVSINSAPEKKKFSELDEMKEDMAETIAEAILADPKTQEIMKMAKPFVGPAFKQLIKELGEDKVRFMLWRDPETGTVVFQRIPTDNIADLQYVSEPDPKDLFLIQEKDLNNMDDLIKKLFAKFGTKLF